MEMAVKLSVHVSKGEVDLWWPNEYGNRTLYEMTVMFHGNNVRW